MEGRTLWSSVIFIRVNLLQDHNKRRNEHVVDIWKYGETETVCSQHHACGGMLTVHLQNQMVRLMSKIFYEAAFEGWSDAELSQLTFCTHFSNQGVGVTKIESAWSLFEATLHHEIADLMRSVGSQVDIHLCFERLEDWRFLGSEEQIAWFRAVPSIRFPCAVHANYLPMYHCLVMLNNWYYLSIAILASWL